MQYCTIVFSPTVSLASIVGKLCTLASECYPGACQKSLARSCHMYIQLRYRYLHCMPQRALLLSRIVWGVVCHVCERLFQRCDDALFWYWMQKIFYTASTYFISNVASLLFATQLCWFGAVPQPDLSCDMSRTLFNFLACVSLAQCSCVRLSPTDSLTNLPKCPLANASKARERGELKNIDSSGHFSFDVFTCHNGSTFVCIWGYVIFDLLDPGL